MKTIPIKVYENDRTRMHIVQARLEIKKNRKLTQADVFRWMLLLAEGELKEIGA